MLELKKGVDILAEVGGIKTIDAARKLFQEKLLEQGILKQADIDRIDAEATKEMEEAEKFAAESPIPSPDNLGKFVYAD